MIHISHGLFTCCPENQTIIKYNSKELIGGSIHLKVGDALPTVLLHEMGHIYHKHNFDMDYYSKNLFVCECEAWLWALDKSIGMISKGAVIASLRCYARLTGEHNLLWKYKMIAKLANLCKLP